MPKSKDIEIKKDNDVDIPLNDGKAEHKHNLNFPLVLQYLKGGFTLADIARKENVSNQAVSQFCKYHDIDYRRYKAYKDNQADVMDYVACKFINSIDAKDIKKTPAVQRVTAVGILTDKARLIRGESTENIIHADLDKEREHQKKKLNEYEKKHNLPLTE